MLYGLTLSPVWKCASALSKQSGQTGSSPPLLRHTEIGNTTDVRAPRRFTVSFSLLPLLLPSGRRCERSVRQGIHIFRPCLNQHFNLFFSLQLSPVHLTHTHYLVTSIGGWGASVSCLATRLMAVVHKTRTTNRHFCPFARLKNPLSLTIQLIKKLVLRVIYISN